MGWIEGLNDAMDYIEANLEGDLDLAHAARLAACTEGQFRRMFSYIAGIGLGEYVRRRRISRAALWIGNTYLDDSGRDSPASLNSTGDM